MFDPPAHPCASTPRLFEWCGCALLALLLASVLGASSAGAQPDSTRARTAAPQLWAIAVNRSNLGTLDSQLAGKARGHVNALLVSKRRLKSGQRRRLSALAKRYGFRRITLPASATSSLRRAESRCAKVKRRHPNSLCTLLAPSLVKAERLAGSRSVDRVIVRMKTLPSLKTLKSTGAAGHANVVFLVAIGRHRNLNKSRWRAAIAEARSDAGLDLAVSPAGRYRTRALSDYLALLNSGNVTPPPPPPPAGTANLWVDTSGGSCTRSASPTGYNDAQACSWSAANSRCGGGDTVGVRGGSYGNVRIRGSNGRGSACTFRTSSGQSVVVGELNLGEWQSCNYGANSSSTTNWFTLVGPIRTREFHADCSNRVTVDRMDMNAGGAQITQPFQVQADATYFTLRNSKVHNVLNANAMMVIEGSNYTFDHNEIYDDLNNTNGAIHDECMYVLSVSNMTMTRNHFWSCNIQDVFLTGSERASNWRVENNIFEAPTGSSGNAANAFAFRAGSSPSPSPDGFVLRYNTFGSSGVQVNQTDNPPTSAGFTVVGNYFDTNAPCGLSNTTYAYNITPTGTSNCGGTGSRSFSASSLHAGFVAYRAYAGDQGGSAQAPGDYRLVSGSPLINRGTTGNYPSLDFTGVGRYAGSAPDVGAFEFR